MNKFLKNEIKELLKNNDFDKALEKLKGYVKYKKYDLLDLHYEMAYVYIHKGNVLFENKGYNESINNYKSALYLINKYSKNYTEIKKVISGIYYSKAKAYLANNNESNAKRCYEKSINYDKKNYNAICGLALLYNSCKNYKKAITIFDELISNENKPEYYFHRGNSYFLMGMYLYAIDNFNKVIDFNTEYIIDAYNHRGVSYAFLMEYDKAINDFDIAISIDKNDVTSYINAGNTYSMKKLYDIAMEYYNKAKNIKPDYYKIYNNIANIYYFQKKYSLAIENYKKSIEYNYEEPNTHCNLGNAYNYNKEYQKAIDSFEEALRLDKDYVDAYNNLGFLYYHKQDTKCMDYFNKAIKLSPKNTLNIFNAINNLNKNNIIDNKVLIKALDKMLNKSIKNNINSNYSKYKLYKYMSIDNLIKSIKDNKVIEDTFKDPADPPIKLDKNIFRNLESITNRIKIISLYNNNDSILMWSHYANEHKGVCVEYDFSNFDFNKINGCIKKVYYSNSVVFNAETSGFLLDENMSPPEYKHDFLHIYNYKYVDWKYEDEYRIIFYNQNCNYITANIKAIYMGKETKNDDIESIKNIITTNKNIKLYKMESKKDNLFKLCPNEIY